MAGSPGAGVTLSLHRGRVGAREPGREGGKSKGRAERSWHSSQQHTMSTQAHSSAIKNERNCKRKKSKREMGKLQKDRSRAAGVALSATQSGDRNLYQGLLWMCRALTKSPREWRVQRYGQHWGATGFQKAPWSSTSSRILREGRWGNGFLMGSLGKTDGLTEGMLNISSSDGNTGSLTLLKGKA